MNPEPRLGIPRKLREEYTGSEIITIPESITSAITISH